LYSNKFKNFKNTLESQQIWDKFKGGDVQSLEQIYEENINNLYNYGKSICQNEALVADQIQDLFVYLWENKSNLSTPISVKGYLLKSLKNRIIDHYRKSNRFNISDDLSNIKATTLSQEDEIIAFETTYSNQNKLKKAIEKLSTKQKEIIYLKYTKNLPYEEIADLLDINYQSVRNLVHRAMIELRKEMLLLTLVLFY
jgi:RNA polymerase sigma factor (sigma-70 family)